MEEIQWPSDGDTTSLAPSIKNHFVCVEVVEIKNPSVCKFFDEKLPTISKSYSQFCEGF